MHPELLILRQLLVRKTYDEFRGRVPTGFIRTNLKELWNVFQTLDLLMKQVPTPTEFTVDELAAYFVVQFPHLKSAERTSYDAIWSHLKADPGSSEVGRVLLETLSQRAYASEVALQAYEFSEGRVSFDVLQSRIQTLTADRQVPLSAVEYVSDDLEELYSSAVAEIGLRWRLASLNLRLGSVRKGDFGFVFARPETGKTTFLASEATSMASQAAKEAKGPVLWLNNEEQGNKVKLRCYEAHFGLSLPEMADDLAQYKQRYMAELGGKIRMVDRASISQFDVERLCKDLSPSLIIMDQIDKIKGFDSDREDLRLGYIYQWARELAKSYAPVIAVCQADGSGEGQRWLSMANVANAKTSKQAEADWILGIGRVNDPGYDEIRYLHLSKNKLLGDKDTNPGLRHDRWEVLIEPRIARYTDLKG
jgi:hypothetical protein